MDFDRLARWYRWLEYGAFGRALERRRRMLLSWAASHKVRSALLIGEGDGRFLAELLMARPKLKIDCVDASARMLAAAKARVLRRCGQSSMARVRFHHADAQTWLDDCCDTYDLIVTHFFLDCFEVPELRELVASLARMCAPGSRWLISDFRQPRYGWRAWRAAAWLWMMYTFFRWTAGLRAGRLVDYRPLLAALGFQLERMATDRTGLLISEVWRRTDTVREHRRLDYDWGMRMPSA